MRAQHNPADILRGALIAPKVKHHAALLDPIKVGELLRAIDAYGGKIETRIALQLAPHVYLRPGELRKAEWSEIDFEAKVWRVPGERTKMRVPHAVPGDCLAEAAQDVGQSRHIPVSGKQDFPQADM